MTAAWYDQPLTASEGPILLERTRRVLAEIQREQEALGRELAASGLTDFSDRFEWLVAHRTPLEALAFELKAARLEGWHTPTGSLAVKRRARRRPVKPAIAPNRALEIAIAALDRGAR